MEGLMRILIADDHPIICIALAEMLGVAFHDRATVETVYDSDSLLCCLGTSDYGLLVLDLEMPGKLQSVPLLNAVVNTGSGVRVVVYTGHAHPSLALAAFDLGVRGYVLKASGPNLAIDAIRAVSEGGLFVDPALDIEFARSHPWHQLTPSERQVLLAIAQGQPLQAVAIDTGRSYKTITAHKYNALHKLGLRSNAEIGPYLAAHGLGYLLG